MESVFCKEYISLFHNWKNRLHSEHLTAQQHHTAVKKLFLRLVNLQFCIENKWISLEEIQHTSLPSTLFSSLPSSFLAQSNLFHFDGPELSEIPNECIEEFFGSNGFFSRFLFSSSEKMRDESHLTPAVLGTLFEGLLENRQAQGAFYTPIEVVHFMVHKSFEKRFSSAPNEQEILSLKIIDPACGSGALLLGCAGEFERRYSTLNTSLSLFDFKSHVLQHCLYGVDLDQAALDIAQTRLWYWLNDGLTQPKPLPKNHLVEGNSVTGSNPQNPATSLGFEFDQHFPEAFETASAGFDIVVANPPYVRQESIEKEVKEHVRKHGIFEGTISGMSDLYAYFYARATQLLCPDGVSSFICSNTWMDVGYGRYLQYEFLSQFTDIEIFGSKRLRQFNTAEINTVLTFMRKAKDLNSDVQFTMLNADFEESIASENNQTKRVVAQSTLLEIGMNSQTYVGSKWSLYLHAPPLYHHIMNVQREKFISIREMCQRTLRNNLRVLPKGYSVEERLTGNDSRPYVQSFKDVSCVRVEPSKQHAVSHPNLVSSLSKPTYCRPDLVANRFFNSRMFFIEGGDYFVSDSFFLGQLKSEYQIQEVLLSLNSTLSLLLVELGGRRGLGGGLLSFYGPEFKTHLTLHPSFFSSFKEEEYQLFVEREIFDVFDECGFDKQRAILSFEHEQYLPIRSQKPNPLPDRKAIDTIVFEALNLSLEQQNEVYWSLCESVLNRLQKASSV